MALWSIGEFKGIHLITLLGTVMLLGWLLNALAVRNGLLGLRVERRIPEMVFAGQPVTIDLEIDNAKRKSKAGLRVEDQSEFHGIYWFIARLEGQSSQQLRQRVTFPKRGPVVWQPTRVSCGAPFGLVEKQMVSLEAPSLIVLPRIGRLSLTRLRRHLMQPEHSLGQTKTSRPKAHAASQSELHGVRAFRNGDSPRWIHWRTTARRNELMVREFEDTPTDNLIVVLDPHLSSELPVNLSILPSRDRPAQFEADLVEDAISLAATLCWEWCRQPGNRLVLAIAGSKPRVISAKTDGSLAPVMLQALALANGENDPAYSSALEQIVAGGVPYGPVVLVTSRTNSFGAHLRAKLRRPVTVLEAARIRSYDFYEPPDDDAI
jgi:uncharacterized protein (DUF58 family)